MNGRGLAVALVVLLSASVARAADDVAVLVVVGAPGSAEYGARFDLWAERWRTAGTRAGASVSFIGRSPGAAPDRDILQKEIARLGARPGGPLWIVLVGHGTFDGRTARFNLRGPDVSADELAKWLANVRRPLVVIDAAPASAPFLKALSGPERVIVTATKTGNEQNATRFGDFFSAAVSDPAADLDKDGQTSLLEAFLAASRRTQASYTDAGLLASEHALLDDNGDGLGTDVTFFSGLRPASKADGAGTPDGARAHKLHLVPSAPERALSDRDRRRRDELERKVADLRETRPRLSEDAYYARLEPLLLELARLYERAER